MKKISIKFLSLLLIMLVLGAGIGMITTKVLTRNDCFELIGQETIFLAKNETYKDDGCKIISFGKDIGADVVIETDLEINDNGEYFTDVTGIHYIKYAVKSLKYGTIFKVQKVRTLIFEESGESGE